MVVRVEVIFWDQVTLINWFFFLFWSNHGLL
jgi:hypothetical protein